MAASEETCDGNPNFAIICSFITNFGDVCGVSVNIPSLQQMLEDTKHVHPVLQEIIIHLMRRGKKRVTKERWERCLVKYCHEYSSVDAWELERFGFSKAKLSVKLEILKRLLELQFDANAKFKAEVNKQDAKELRLLPLGRDIDGQAYWYQLDKDHNMRLYKESLTDDHMWQLLCTTTDELRNLLDRLEKKYSISTGESIPFDLKDDPKSPPSDDLPVPKKENEEMTSSISQSKPCTIIIKREADPRLSSSSAADERPSNLPSSRVGEMTSTTIEDDKGGFKLKLKFETHASRAEQQKSEAPPKDGASKKGGVAPSALPMDLELEESAASVESKGGAPKSVEMEVDDVKPENKDAAAEEDAKTGVEVSENGKSEDMEVCKDVDISENEKSVTVESKPLDQKLTNSSATVPVLNAPVVYRSSKIKLYEKWNSEKNQASLSEKTSVSSQVLPEEKSNSETSLKKEDCAVTDLCESGKEIENNKDDSALNLSKTENNSDVTSSSSRCNVIVSSSSKHVISNGIQSEEVVRSKSPCPTDLTLSNTSAESLAVSKDENLSATCADKVKGCGNSPILHHEKSLGSGFSHLQALQNMCETNSMGGLKSATHSDLAHSSVGDAMFGISGEQSLSDKQTVNSETQDEILVKSSAVSHLPSKSHLCCGEGSENQKSKDANLCKNDVSLISNVSSNTEPAGSCSVSSPCDSKSSAVGSDQNFHSKSSSVATDSNKEPSDIKAPVCDNSDVKTSPKTSCNEVGIKSSPCCTNSSPGKFQSGEDPSTTNQESISSVNASKSSQEKSKLGESVEKEFAKISDSVQGKLVDRDKTENLSNLSNEESKTGGESQAADEDTSEVNDVENMSSKKCLASLDVVSSEKDENLAGDSKNIEAEALKPSSAESSNSDVNVSSVKKGSDNEENIHHKAVPDANELNHDSKKDVLEKANAGEKDPALGKTAASCEVDSGINCSETENNELKMSDSKSQLDAKENNHDEAIVKAEVNDASDVDLNTKTSCNSNGVKREADFKTDKIVSLSNCEASNNADCNVSEPGAVSRDKIQSNEAVKTESASTESDASSKDAKEEARNQDTGGESNAESVDVPNLTPKIACEATSFENSDDGKELLCKNVSSPENATLSDPSISDVSISKQVLSEIVTSVSSDYKHSLQPSKEIVSKSSSACSPCGYKAESVKESSKVDDLLNKEEALNSVETSKDLETNDSLLLKETKSPLPSNVLTASKLDNVKKSSADKTDSVMINSIEEQPKLERKKAETCLHGSSLSSKSNGSEICEDDEKNDLSSNSREQKNLAEESSLRTENEGGLKTESTSKLEEHQDEIKPEIKNKEQSKTACKLNDSVIKDESCSIEKPLKSAEDQSSNADSNIINGTEAKINNEDELVQDSKEDQEPEEENKKEISKQKDSKKNEHKGNEDKSSNCLLEPKEPSKLEKSLDTSGSSMNLKDKENCDAKIDAIGCKGESSESKTASHDDEQNIGKKFTVYYLRSSLCLESKMKPLFHSRYLKPPLEETKKQLLTELKFDFDDDEPLINYSNAAKILKAQIGLTSPNKKSPPKKTPTKRAPRRVKKGARKDFNIPEGFLEILGSAESSLSDKLDAGKRKKTRLKEDQTSQQSSENETNPRKRSRRIQEQHKKKMSELAVEMEREQRRLEQMAKKSKDKKIKTPQKTPTKEIKSSPAKVPVVKPVAKTPTKGIKAKKIDISIIEEETCMESKRATRKMNNRSKNLTKMTLMYEDESKDSQFSTSRETDRSKRRKRRRGGKRGSYKPWDVSSESTSSVEEITEEEEEEPEEILVFDVNEDEFACEEVDQDAEPVLVRRARTAKKTEGPADEESVIDDKPCKKCGKLDKPEWILLCDKCDNGYHTHCLVPPLMIVPDGDWFCQPCEHMFLCQCLQEELKKLENILKQKEREVLRKQRLAYVGISLDNALKPEKKEGEEDEEEGKESSDSTEGADKEEKSHKPKKVKEPKEETSEDERHKKLYAKRSIRARRNVNYRFKEYDELIASALQEEIGEQFPAEVLKEDDEENEEDASDANSDKPFTARITRKKRRTRSFKNLDDFSDDDDSGDDYHGGSTDSEATPPAASASEPDSHPSDAEWCVKKSKSKARSKPSRQKSKARRRRRRGRGGSSEEEEESNWSDEELEDSDNQRPLTRRSAAQKPVSYREISSEDDEWGSKPKKTSKRRKETSSSEESEKSFKKQSTKKKRIKKWASSDSESEAKSGSSSEEESEEENSEESENDNEMKKKERLRLKASTNKKVLSSEEDEESSTQDSAPVKKSKKADSEESEEEEEEEEDEETDSEEESEEEEKPKEVPPKAKEASAKKPSAKEQPKVEKVSSEKTKPVENSVIKLTSSLDEKSLIENQDLQPKVVIKKEVGCINESDISPKKALKKDSTKMVPGAIPYDKSPPEDDHQEQTEDEPSDGNLAAKDGNNTAFAGPLRPPMQYPNQAPPPLAPIPSGRIQYAYPERYGPPHPESGYYPPPSYPGNRMPPRLMSHPSMPGRMPVDPGNMPSRYGPPAEMSVGPTGHLPMRPGPSRGMMMRPGPASSMQMRPCPPSNMPMRPGMSSAMSMRHGPPSSMSMRPDYPGSMPMRPDHPSGMPMRPDHPSGMPMRPDHPSGMPMRPDHPSGMPMRPDHPSGMPMRPDHPSSMPMRPDHPSGMPMRPDHPSGMPMRPDHPSGMPMRPDHPSSMPMRPDRPSGMPMRSIHPISRPMRSDHHGSMPMRQDQPDSMPMRLDQPSSISIKSEHPSSIPIKPDRQSNIPIRPDHPNSMPMRPDHSNSMPMRPDHSNSMPMRPDHPSNMPMRPDHPSNMPMRPDHPSNMPMRHGPPTSMPMRHVPLSSMPMRPGPPVNMSMRSGHPDNMPMRPGLPGSMPMRHGPSPSSLPMRPSPTSNMPMKLSSSNRPGPSSNSPSLHSSSTMQPRPSNLPAKTEPLIEDIEARPNSPNTTSGQDSEAEKPSSAPPQPKVSTASTVLIKSDVKTFKSTITEPFQENDSDDEVPLERIPTAAAPPANPERPPSYEKDTEYRPAAKELSTFNYASSDEKSFPRSYSPMPPFQDYSDRPSPLKPSLVETYPNSSSPSKLTPLESYSRSNSPKGFISLDTVSEKRKKQHFFGHSSSEGEGSGRPRPPPSDSYQGGEIRFPPEPYPCPQSPNSYRSPPPASQRDPGTPPRMYSQFPDAYAPPRSPEYYQNHQYYGSEERISRPSYQPNYASSEPPSFVSNPYVATPVPQPNGGFMIDTLLRARNHENEEDELTGVTDIVSYITQE